MPADSPHRPAPTTPTGLPAAACSDLTPPTERRTDLGPILGLDNSVRDGSYAWLGVPFARPPVGALRWKPPVDPEPWTTPRPAQRFGPASLQIGRIYGPGANNTYDATIGTTLNTPVGSEDCLYLNLWRPATAEEGLPVLVFVHGGSNVSGYTADPMFDCAALAKRANALVVTVNYRLGILGFFNLPQLKDGADADEASGNFALLDIVQALRFVQRNAAQFGGNPDNVTLMGQSAGAINVWALLTSPRAAGLFQRAVPVSGGISLPGNLPPGSIPTLMPAAAYLAQSMGLLAQLLIADGKASDAESAQAFIATQSNAQIADYLRGKDGGALLSIVFMKALGGSGPIPDGQVLPADPIAAIAAGQYHRVPVLASNTADEGKLFAPFLTLLGGPPGFVMDDATRFERMRSADPDAAPTLSEADIIHPAYLPSDAPETGWSAKTAQLAALFMGPSRDSVLNTLAVQQPAAVWYFQFDWAQEPPPWNTVYGAAHALDLPFLFGTFGPSLFANATNTRANAPGRLALSGAMMDSIATFMRQGDPNHAGLGVAWAPWPAVLHFDATPSAVKISLAQPS